MSKAPFIHHPVRSSIFLLLPMLLQGQDFTYGTAIVILRTPNTIYAAADSMLVTAGSTTTETECKIRFAGETGFALAGIFVEPASGFDLIKIIKKVCLADRPLTAKFASLEEAVRAPLLSAMNNIYHHPLSPALDHLGVQIALFGFEGKTSYVYRITLDAVAEGSNVTDLRVKKTIVPDEKNNEPYCLVFLAQSADVLATLQSTRLSGKDWRDALNQVIQLAIEKNPSSVGPPVDIVEVTDQGRRWLQRKDGCPD